MGYSYNEREYSTLQNMHKKEEKLIGYYKNGNSYNGKYICTLYGDGKMPKWCVCDKNIYDDPRQQVKGLFASSSFKKCVEYCRGA